VSRFRFVCDHRGGYPVKRLCQLVGVSRSGFYAWAARPVSARERANLALLEVIREIHTASRGTYGRVRIIGQLRRRGISANHKRVAKLMRINAIMGVGGPRKARRAGRRLAPAPDLIQRDFTAQKPNQRWVADLTEFQTLEGKLHLAAILDLYADRIVGWATSDRRDAEIAVDALVMAIRRRRPPDGVIHHADLGSQFTSLAFCDRAWDEKVRLSFGRVGTAADNARMEAFWSVLKRELEHIHAQQIWSNRAALRAALFDYIEVFYNRERHQAGLGHKTPAEYEADLEKVA
jgi:transposase InsO family protein